jgi:ABC-2 type transport system ATP-binding protein
MYALSVHGLSKRYRNGVHALQGIDLQVAEGDFFALLGPNGAGKSTLISICTSLVTKTAGSVQVFGHDLDTDLEGAKSCIGIVPQEFNLNMFETPETIVVNKPASTASRAHSPASAPRSISGNSPSGTSGGA